MDCPFCGATSREIRVVETAHTKDQTRRRRSCGLCSQRFSTVEIVVNDRQRTTTKDLVIMPAGSKKVLTRR
jgi:transcriptional regulator NrdR family protein